MIKISNLLKGITASLFVTSSLSAAPVISYIPANAYDVSTAVYPGAGEEFSVRSEENAPAGLAFNSDGTKMFVIGFTGDAVVEYTLGTAFDVSTAVYAGAGEEFSVSSQESAPQGLAFNPDGTKMFVIGNNGGAVVEYTLGTAFDVSTAVYTGAGQEFPVSSEESVPASMAFNANGTKMFVTGTTGDAVVEYTVEYVAGTPNGFTEVPANDGSVQGKIDFILDGDTFADVDGDNILDIGTEVTVNNIPAGLTGSITLSAGDTVGTLTLTDNATAHQSSDDVADITFTFDDSAFTTALAASVNGATGPASGGAGVDLLMM
ncbi:MAG: Unknown protein [uncultured Campylobacterales bacterium]|uniref:Uncharacterized protein n=1 Tax=uncultured Campylobacterales bacterium TaxID=352960 RepID=A0A6S6SPY8_9BACT|nr:MAG: Unknown protein [uncultured Campylobacterales bacterium]